MTAQNSRLSTDYLECASRLRRLHDLIRVGEGDSERAEELRDEMDLFWRRMSDEERDRIGKLSAELSTIGLNPEGVIDRSWVEKP